MTLLATLMIDNAHRIGIGNNQSDRSQFLVIGHMIWGVAFWSARSKSLLSFTMRVLSNCLPLPIVFTQTLGLTSQGTNPTAVGVEGLAPLQVSGGYGVTELTGYSDRFGSRSDYLGAPRWKLNLSIAAIHNINPSRLLILNLLRA